MIVEFAVVAVVGLIGWSVLAASGLKDWGIVPLAIPVGTGVVVASSLVLVVLRQPTRPFVLLGVAAIVGSSALLAAVVKRQAIPLGAAGWFLGGTLAVVALARSLPLVKYHIDSFHYLSGARLLATGQFEHFGDAARRSLAMPAMHSLGSVNGDWYLASLSPLLALSVAGVLGWAVARSRLTRLTGPHVGWFVALAVLLYGTNNRMVWNAFYVNQHLLFGAGFLMMCASGWLFSRRPAVEHRSLTLLTALGAVLVVLSRPEGFLVMTLALLPIVLGSYVTVGKRRILVLAAAGVTMAWFGYLALWSGSINRSLAVPLLIAIAGLAGLPLVGATWLEVRGRRLLLLTEVGLWLLLLWFALLDPGRLQIGVAATYRNVVLGAGSWGMSLVMLGAIAACCLVMAPSGRLVAMRFPLTAMVPTFFVISYLGGPRYRVGNGDSLNRMLTQIVPTLILFVVVAVMLLAQGRESETSPGVGAEA